MVLIFRCKDSRTLTKRLNITITKGGTIDRERNNDISGRIRHIYRKNRY